MQLGDVHTDQPERRSERDLLTASAKLAAAHDRWAVRAYRFALDPTPVQEEMLRSHCGAQRFAYNWGLRLIMANLAQRAAERSYGIADDELTPVVHWSAYELRKTWNRVKDDIAPWWRQNSKEAYASGLANLAAALSNWAGSRSGKRRGARIRFPRLKAKKARLSCRFTTGAFGLVHTDRRHVKLPRTGVVRTHESTRKLARHVAAGTARIRSATVTYARGRWLVSFSVDFRNTQRQVRAPHGLIGVDLGVKHLAVLSAPVPGVSDATGMVANPAHLERSQRALRRLQRQAARRHGPDKHTGGKSSKRWRHTQAKIARLHARVANSRADGLHQLTTALSERFSLIVVEDLNIVGLLANRRLARRIACASWGELRRQLSYKTEWRGGRLLVADRFYPSSKKCSKCSAVKAKLRLSQRIYHCDACGMSMDRDLNAARNLAALAGQTTTGASSPSCGATENEPMETHVRPARLAAGTATGSPTEDNVA